MIEYAICPNCKEQSVYIEYDTGDYVCKSCNKRFEYYSIEF